MKSILSHWHSSIPLTLFVLLLPVYSHGQILSGSVNDATSFLSGAIIRNVNKNKISVSDLDGRFTIPATKGDTLTTSFIGYKTETIIVNDQSSLSVYLFPLIHTLHEVVIKRMKLSPLEQYRKNQEDYKQIYRIGDNSHLFSALGGYRRAGVGISIDALYSTFSKAGKNARKLQRTLTNDYYDSIIDSRFNPDLVSRITGYKGRELEDFMINNRPTYEFIRSAADYDIIEFIKRRAQGMTVKTNPPPPAIKPETRRFSIKFKMPNIKPKN